MYYVQTVATPTSPSSTNSLSIHPDGSDITAKRLVRQTVLGQPAGLSGAILAGQSSSQTPSTGVRHPSFNHCRIYSYAIGSRKLSANEQSFVGAQTVVSLLQISEIISDVCYVTDHVIYASSNKTKIV